MGGDLSTMDTLLSRPHQEKNIPRSEPWDCTWERRNKRLSRIGKACTKREDGCGAEEVEGRFRKEWGEGTAQGRRKAKSRRVGVRVVIIACTMTLSDINRRRWYNEPWSALEFAKQTGGTGGRENERKLGWER